MICHIWGIEAPDVPVDWLQMNPGSMIEQIGYESSMILREKGRDAPKASDDDNALFCQAFRWRSGALLRHGGFDSEWRSRFDPDSNPYVKNFFTRYEKP